MGYKSELQFENELINYLSNAPITADSPDTPLLPNGILRTRNWEYMPKLNTEEKLWENFKKILEQHNTQTLDRPLSYTEFEQVKKVICDLTTPYKAGQFLYGHNGVSQIEIDMDDGRHVYLTVFDQSQIGAGNTVYQVVHQVHRPAVIRGKRERRFDVTLLINGLPIIQIELKKDSGKAREALEQMHQYIYEHQYSGIFSTLQLLIAMTPNDCLYMANTTDNAFNTDFAFHWQKEADNQSVRNWQVFTDQVLSIPAAHNLATNFMILDGTPNKEAIKVMRPYQVYATQHALDAIKKRDLEAQLNKLGYIWHTTGSGKTITSFKTAWLASRLPHIDKVVFCVDRKTLTNQTLDNYRAYDPEASRDEDSEFSSIADTKNTWSLARKLKHNSQDIIVTSIQKLEKLAKGSFVPPDKNYLFIVDEAHRSTNGEAFEKVQKFFPHSSWIGYTGTPMVESGKTKTVDIFGKCLHAYTIREAIADKNVLGFNVEFMNTFPKDLVREQILPEFYHAKNPEMTEQEIQEKIANLSDMDIDDEVSETFYDDNPKHVEAVVEDIYRNWDARSVNGKYSAMLTTHVGGGKSSIPMALMYFEEFQRVNKERDKNGEKTLKVAITFSEDKTNKRGTTEKNSGLSDAIDAYNKTFGTEFGPDSLDLYRNDVEMRLKKNSQDKNNLDLVIVVDQMLTGFDAPMLNTLYVDRVLSMSTLVQAYSRTNRIFDMNDKPFGHIINYRWPERNEQRMKEALAIYSNKEYANLTPAEQQTLIDGLDEDGILSGSYSETVDKTLNHLSRIRDLTYNFDRIPDSEEKQDELLKVYRKFNASISELKQFSAEQIAQAKNITLESLDSDYPEFNPMNEILDSLHLTEDEADIITGPLANELKEAVGKRNNIPPAQVDLTVVHLKDVEVNYDYLTELLEDLLNSKHENDESAIQEAVRKIQEFSKSLDDRHYAKEILLAAQAIIDGTYPDENSKLTYPYNLTSSTEIVEHAQSAATNVKMDEFIRKWGLDGIISPERLGHLLKHHTYGEADLDEYGKLSNILSKAQQQYGEFANDPEIKSIKVKVRYRKQLREAIQKLADELVSE